MTSLLQKIFYDKDGNVVIAQKPNAPAVVWLLALIGMFFIDETSATYDWLLAIFMVALIVWAFLEIFLGVNFFRRFLGLLAVVYLITKLF
jgi:hypothetical protein